MELQCLNNSKTKIINIDYCPDSKVIIFCFLSGDDGKKFSTTAENKGGIKFISSTAELDEFLMTLMIRDSQIIKRINKIAWDYIEGREVTFPIQLVP